MPDSATEVLVREATEADLDAIVPLFDRYRVFYGQQSDTELARNFLGERLKAGDSKIFVGQCGETICGFIQMYPSFSSTAAATIWVLNDLFVEPDTRGSGIATALLTQAVDHAKATGAHHLELATARDNVPARELYEKLGWIRDEVFVHYYRAPQD